MAAAAILGAAEMVVTGYVMGRLQRQGRAAYLQDEAQLVDLLLAGLTPGPRSGRR